MIGRADNKFKRFNIGIQSIEYLNLELPKSETKIISNMINFKYLRNITISLNLNKRIYFYNYTSIHDIYLINASLHLFLSISESFGLILCETKIFGIHNNLMGLYYISIANNRTNIIYNDVPEYIGKESLKS